MQFWNKVRWAERWLTTPQRYPRVCHACMLSSSVMSCSLQLPNLQPSRLLCPWNFPGKNTGVGGHFFLQGIFPTRGPNPWLLCLPHWQVDSLPLSYLGSPKDSHVLILKVCKCLGKGPLTFSWGIWDEKVIQAWTGGSKIQWRVSL